MSGNANHDSGYKTGSPSPHEMEQARRALQTKIDTANIIAMVRGELVITTPHIDSGAAGSRAIRYYAESRVQQEPGKPRLAGPWITRQEAILEFPDEHNAFVNQEAVRKARESIAPVPDAPEEGGQVIQMFAQGPESAVQ